MAGPLDSLVEVVATRETAPAAAVGLGLIFGWSGVAKWLAPLATAQALVSFRLVSRISRPAARTIALVEIALGVALLTVPLLGAEAMVLTLACAAAVCAGFVLVIAAALRRPERFPCHCFGSSESELSTLTLLRASGLVVAAGIGAAAATGSAGSIGGADWLLWIVSGGGVMSCLAMLSRLPALLRFDDPFDFSDQTMLEPTGFGPIAHDHD